MDKRENTREYAYSGILSALCESFVEEKRAVGYKFNKGAQVLSAFSRFTESFELPENTLTEEVFSAWSARRSTETKANQFHRFYLVRQLAEFMVRLGYEAYIPIRGEIGKMHEVFTPYIFSHSEINRFFTEANQLKHNLRSGAPRRHIVMPVIFRILYCCGLRVSEAVCLLGDDVNLETGVLSVRDSKFGKSRYIPMSEELTNVCRNYAKTRLVAPIDKDDWFFAAPDGGQYSEHEIYHVFREILWKAGISHGGKGKGPRLHDFRHTFAVHCLQKWVESGAELTTAIPRLSAYLGHEGFASTEQYLRMTAEVYPQISELMQKQFGYIVSREESVLNEND